jgi:HEAT repeat protein
VVGTTGEPDDRNVADTSVARRAAAIAGHVGDDAAARALVTHDAADVRAAAYGALARMEALGPDDARIALADPSPLVRRRAIALAISLDGVELLPLLHDRDASVVEQTAWALGEREDPAAVEELIGACSHADALVREAAVAALGAIGDERGLPAILAACEDKPAIRRRAVLALAPFDGPEVDAALARAAEDRDWQVRDAADVVSNAR